MDSCGHCGDHLLPGTGLHLGIAEGILPRTVRLRRGRRGDQGYTDPQPPRGIFCAVGLSGTDSEPTGQGLQQSAAHPGHQATAPGLASVASLPTAEPSVTRWIARIDGLSPLLPLHLRLRAGKVFMAWRDRLLPRSSLPGSYARVPRASILAPLLPLVHRGPFLGVESDLHFPGDVFNKHFSSPLTA